MRRWLFLALVWIASPAAAQNCPDSAPPTIVEAGARLVECAGRRDPDATRRSGAFVRAVSAAYSSTPGQRVTMLAGASALFADEACRAAWQSGERVLDACRAAYCPSCRGDDAVAFTALIGAALERDYHLSPGAMSRWIAAALLPRVMTPTAWSTPGLVLDHDGVRYSSRWVQRASEIRRPIATAADRVALLTALPARPRPLSIALASMSFEITTMIAALIEARVVFRLVEVPAPAIAPVPRALSAP
jgi:hypothetical protein